MKTVLHNRVYRVGAELEKDDFALRLDRDPQAFVIDFDRDFEQAHFATHAEYEFRGIVKGRRSVVENQRFVALQDFVELVGERVFPEDVVVVLERD